MRISIRTNQNREIIVNKFNKAILEVGHPQDVHQFNQIYLDLKEKGWKLHFVAKDKDIVISLLEKLNLPYTVIGKTRKSILMKLLTIPVVSFKLLITALRFKPDILLSRVSVHSGIVSRILRIPHIGFADTESTGLLDKISVPFTDAILTSHSFKKSYGKKQLTYPGYIELWYLHPSRFKPNDEVYRFLGINKDERFMIIRFISWDAHHDIGLQGLSLDRKIQIVKSFSNHIRVFISSECQLPAELEEYKINIPIEMMHHAMYYAEIIYGESATMAAEAAILGTHGYFLYHHNLGYIEDLEARSGLVHYYSLSDEQIKSSTEHALNTIKNRNEVHSKEEVRFKLLEYCIDPVSFVCNFIQSYPENITGARSYNAKSSNQN